MIRVAVVHYHLRSGGVTRVIEHAVASLKNRGARVVVLSGEEPAEHGVPENQVRIVRGIDYAVGEEAPRAEVLARQMEESARQALGGLPDVWHFHNHALGKNCALTAAVSVLAEAGHRVLLQIHDFAEDGRPHLFQGLVQHLGGGRIEALGLRMYPRAPHVHYAAINGRDARLLAEAGAAPDCVHLLPNAVTLDAGSLQPWDPNPQGSRLVLYPVRAIRRKNLGEFLLWATLAGREERFAVTLAPKSAADRRAYDRWVAFAQAQNLPVEFEVGIRKDQPFEERLASAWLAASTSIAEGFGLTFLEPWLVGRPVVGRAIPEIMRDFAEQGVDLTGLYEHLWIPLEWVGRERLQRTIAAGYTRLLAAYGRASRPGGEDRAFAAAVSDGRVDFGRLDEDLQAEVLLRLRASPWARSEMEPSTLCRSDWALRVMALNRDRIRRTCNLENYGERLMSIYRAVADSKPGPVQGGLAMDRLLDAFLAPERFFLLRT